MRKEEFERELSTPNETRVVYPTIGFYDLAPSLCEIAASEELFDTIETVEDLDNLGFKEISFDMDGNASDAVLSVSVGKACGNDFVIYGINSPARKAELSVGWWESDSDGADYENSNTIACAIISHGEVGEDVPDETIDEMLLSCLLAKARQLYDDELGGGKPEEFIEPHF